LTGLGHGPRSTWWDPEGRTVGKYSRTGRSLLRLAGKEAEEGVALR